MSNAENIDDGIPSLDETIQRIASLKLQSQEALPEEVREALGEKPEVNKSASSPASVPDLPATPAVETQGGEAVPQTPEVSSSRISKLLAREAALIERENKLKSVEAGPPVAPVPGLTVEQLRSLYRQDPVKALTALDESFKAGALAKKLWYHDLGDLAPKDARAEYEAEKATGSVEVLRAELEATKQQLYSEMDRRQQEMAYQQYAGATAAYVQSVPDTLPLTKKFTERQPNKVVTALLKTAEKHFQSTGVILSPEQTAVKLEASLKALQFSGDSTPTTASTAPAPKATEKPAAPNTLRNKHTAVQPSRGDDSDPSDEELFKRSMQAIEAAKKRAEAMYK